MPDFVKNGGSIFFSNLVPCFFKRVYISCGSTYSKVFGKIGVSKSEPIKDSRIMLVVLPAMLGK